MRETHLLMYNVQPPTQWDCDFEDRNYCSWNNDNSVTATATWKIQQGATDTPGTGPPGDHTLLSYLGHYIYLESDTYTENSAARYGPTVDKVSYFFPANGLVMSRNGPN